MDSHRNKDKLEIFNMPYLHPKVNPDDVTFDSKTGVSKLKKNAGSQFFYQLQGKTYFLEKYCELGKGSFGAVYLMQDSQGQWLAVKKILDKTNDISEEVKRLNEQDLVAFASQKDGLIGMKLVEGIELFDYIADGRKHQNISLLQRLVIAKHLLQQTAYLHKDVKSLKANLPTREKTIHRDIKTENMLINPSTLAVKHIDLGLAVPLAKTSVKRKHIRN